MSFWFVKEVKNRPVGLVLGLVVFFVLLSTIASSQFSSGQTPAGEGTTSVLGTMLLGDYIVAFEFASVLLLVALVGAAYLVRRAD